MLQKHLKLRWQKTILLHVAQTHRINTLRKFARRSLRYVHITAGTEYECNQLNKMNAKCVNVEKNLSPPRSLSENSSLLRMNF